MATVASLKAVLSLSSVAFERGMSRAQKRMRRFRQSTARATATVRRFGSRLAALAGIGSVAGTMLLVRRQAELMDTLAKTSTRLGVQADKLLGLQRAARLTGSTAEGLNKALEMFARRVGEAATGTGEAVEAFKLLRLDVKELQKMKLSDALMKTVDAVSSLSDVYLKASVSADVFGRSGVGLLNTWNLGAEGLRQIINETRRMGLTFGRLDLARIEAMNDLWADIKQAITRGAAEMALNMVPAIDGMATALGGVGNIARDITSIVRELSGWVRMISLMLLGTFDELVARAAEFTSTLADLATFIPFMPAKAKAYLKLATGFFEWEAEQFREGSFSLVNSFMDAAFATINDIGNRVARFGVQRTPIPELADTSSITKLGQAMGKASLMTLSELGIAGMQPRYGGVMGTPKVEQKVTKMADDVSIIRKLVQQAVPTYQPFAIGA